MEEAAGKRLATQWDESNPNSKLAIMREIVAIETKLLSVSFPRYVFVATLPLFVPLHAHFVPSSYGSIYFSSDEVDGTTLPAQITSDAPIGLKERASKKFSIGPTVERDFWKKERATMDISRGPCRWYLSL